MEVKSLGANNILSQSDYQNDKTDVQAKPYLEKNNIKDEDSHVDRKKLDKSVELANKVLFKDNTHLKFEIHSVTKDVMVQIIDDETGKVLKEIPPKKIIDMIAKICEAAGIFVDEKR